MSKANDSIQIMKRICTRARITTRIWSRGKQSLVIKLFLLTQSGCLLRPVAFQLHFNIADQAKRKETFFPLEEITLNFLTLNNNVILVTCASDSRSLRILLEQHNYSSPEWTAPVEKLNLLEKNIQWYLFFIHFPSIGDFLKINT